MTEQVKSSKGIALDALAHLTKVYHSEFAEYARITGQGALGYPGERYFSNTKEVLDAIYERKGQIIAVRKAIEHECGIGIEIDAVNSIIDTVYKDLNIERPVC